MPDPVSKYMEYWTGGMNSLLHPTNIAPSQYHYGENVFNRGGIIQTRPGFRLMAYLAGAKLQGFTWFQQLNSVPFLVIAIDGLVYYSAWPYNTFTQIQGIQFDANAEIVTFCDCVKSVVRNQDGSLRLIQPYRVLVMQDGASRAAYWDGSIARHLDPEAPFYGTPTGLWMVWTSDRLWLSRGNQIVVSDIDDPLTFSENTYTAERSNFTLPDDCTGLIEANNEQSLLAFTRRTTTAFQSAIRERTSWQNTPQFQQILIPRIGCVSGRSPINAFGLTWWFSEEGWIDLNSALYSLRTSQLTLRDTEMMRSKRALGTQTHRICSGWYENLVLVSVPSGDAYCNHTWVFDNSTADQLNEDSPACWSGIWTGMRPAQWATVNVMGKNRMFCASFDRTAYNETHIHVWEAFQSNRMDRQSPILSQWETRAELPTARLGKFRYAELDLCEILGEVNLKVYYGGLKGPYIQVGEYDFTAEKGSIGSITQQVITDDSVIEFFRPQTRTVKTEEVGSDQPEHTVCIESERPPNIDKAFSILCEWRGRMGIKGIRLITEPITESDQGQCQDGDDPDIRNILKEDGSSEVFNTVLLQDTQSDTLQTNFEDIEVAP